MTNTIPEIAGMAWSEDKMITTRSGSGKLVRSAPVTEQWWALWKEHKEELKKAGFSVGKWGGEFSVSWWEPFTVPDLSSGNIETPQPLPETEPLKITDGLLSYQIKPTELIVHGMEEYGSTLNASKTGVGKTFMTLAAIRERGRKALVICPKTITGDWTQAAKMIGVELVGVFGWEWIKTGKTPFVKWNTRRVKRKLKGEYVLVDQKDNFYWQVPKDVDVVFDECHRAANDGTQNSKLVRLAVEQKLPCFLLSATIADNPTKMRATGLALGLHSDGKDYFDWLMRHGVVKTRFGLQFQGTAKHLKAIHAGIFPHKGVRVSPADLGDAFPKTQIIAKAYTIDESKEIQSVYMEMMAKCMELEAQRADSACILVEILRARQRVELLKVPLMVEQSKDYMAEGNHIFLAVNFRDTLKELIGQLEIKSVIMGGQSPLVRAQAIADFQSDKNPVIAGIIKACREGISLQDIHGNFPRVALIMPTQSPYDLKQVLGRVARATGKSPSIQRILYAASTIEEDVCRGLATKLDQLDLISDGDLNGGIFPNKYSSMRPQTNEESEELPS